MTPNRAEYRLLLIHENPAIADRIRALLVPYPDTVYRIAHFTHIPDALAYLQVDQVTVVLAGQPAGGVTIANAVARIRQAEPEVPVIGLLDEQSDGLRDEVNRAGVNDNIQLDCDEPELWSRVIEQTRSRCLTERRLANALEELDRLAYVDPLTSLLNRQGIEQKLLCELKNCRDNGNDLLVLMIDLDDFSRINASLGHGVGDLVLISAARRIREAINPPFEVGRVGDDKFLVLLPDVSVKTGMARAEEIRLAISGDKIQASETIHTVTASIGLSVISNKSLSINEVLAKAHVALHRSKVDGKNRVCNVEKGYLRNRVQTLRATEELIQSLLREDVFEVVHQPIVDLKDGRIVSREMLIRGPDGPLQRPDQLFRFCNEHDILTTVDLRCLKKTTEAGRAFGDRTGFHVNLMPSTLLETPVEELIRVMQGDGQTDHCCLEISEQQLLGDPSHLIPCVHALQEAGIEIAIDDVGFGNSCLEGLLLLEPQVMKIDKRMIQGVSNDTDLRRALSRLLRIAEVLEAKVITEGIETAEDHHVLLELGARYGQGYLFGRPQPCRPLEPGVGQEVVESSSVAVRS